MGSFFNFNIFIHLFYSPSVHRQVLNIPINIYFDIIHVLRNPLYMHFFEIRLFYYSFTTLVFSIIRWILFKELIWLPWKKIKSNETKVQQSQWSLLSGRKLRVLKTGERASVPWVRIPPSPPFFIWLPRHWITCLDQFRTREVFDGSYR